MNETLADLVRRLNTRRLKDTGVIPWSSPVPVFGDISKSAVATLGLNPSNREFVDEGGKELDGPSRRLHTLRSLRLNRWSEAGDEHVEAIHESCKHYFAANPYDGWFRSLDYILGGANFTYYGSAANACHLDLIPFATKYKWTDLSARQRSSLLKVAGDALGRLLRDSQLRLLLLNGRTVVENLQRLAGIVFDCVTMPRWALPRRGGVGVMGLAYRANLTAVCGVEFHRPILVLGYNHNIQSSFGVTTAVKTAIREWLAEAATRLRPCDPETRRQQNGSTQH